MKTQKALIIKYRERLQNNDIQTNIDGEYNIISGLWENNNGDPLIGEIIDSEKTINGISNSLHTCTRESTDQSENISIFNNTTITKTRESIDQSESINA